MNDYQIDRTLIDLFGSKFNVSASAISILDAVEASLPDLELLPAIDHWPGQIGEPKNFANTKIYGTILSGFYEVNIVNVKYRIIVYLNQTGQMKIKHFKIINQFISSKSYRWNIDKFMDEWIDSLMSEVDKKLLMDTISRIKFQLYRNGMKFVHTNTTSFLVDNHTYKTNYEKMVEYLKQFNLYTTDVIADDMLFLSKNKFVSLGNGYKAKGLKKVNYI